jgi:two-component system NarL family sensor kinase
LRRDLHDGLGPALAGVTLGLHAARVQLRDDPEQADQRLAGIEAQIEETVADVRRLVYGLRPPALDEFGLLRAIELHAARLEDADSLAVTVEAPAEGLGGLGAAVEAAAYRIVTEALTNVARHAGARTCTVHFARNGALELEVTDDGRGLEGPPRKGVGLTAMYERAEELGGTLEIESSAAGTRVLARLPTSDPA